MSGAKRVRLDSPVMRAVVDKAGKRGLTVAAHAHRPEEIPRGLAAGVDWTAAKRRVLACFLQRPAEISQSLLVACSWTRPSGAWPKDLRGEAS